MAQTRRHHYISQFYRNITAASLALLCACAHKPDPLASPTPIPTAGLALAPLPVPLASRDSNALERAKHANVCGNSLPTTADDIGDKIFAGCGQGKVVVLDRNMRELRSTKTQIPMDTVGSIMPAGSNAVAVSGTADGASLRNIVTILNAQTLQPIMQAASDITYLGVYNRRAYIDDWCCNGCANTYAPATVYSVSLKDGTESQHVDLAPDPQAHPARLAPLGQGESNYRIGKYFYVHVEEITYRYDLMDLKRPPCACAVPCRGDLVLARNLRLRRSLAVRA